MTNVILADDHALMRSGLADLLNRNGFQVVAQAASFAELKTAIASQQADVVICDCKMPGDGPVNFMFHLQQHHRALKVIFLTALDSGVLFSQLLCLGAHGLVSKKSDVDDVINALKSVDSQPFISAPICQSIDISIELLSNKEFQIFELIVAGFSNNEIADKINRSASTINTHRVSLMQKLGIHSVVELVHFARKNGLYDE